MNGYVTNARQDSSVGRSTNDCTRRSQRVGHQSCTGAGSIDYRASGGRWSTLKQAISAYSRPFPTPQSSASGADSRAAVGEEGFGVLLARRQALALPRSTNCQLCKWARFASCVHSWPWSTHLICASRLPAAQVIWEQSNPANYGCHDHVPGRAAIPLPSSAAGRMDGVLAHSCRHRSALSRLMSLRRQKQCEMMRAWRVRSAILTAIG